MAYLWESSDLWLCLPGHIILMDQNVTFEACQVYFIHVLTVYPCCLLSQGLCLWQKFLKNYSYKVYLGSDINYVKQWHAAMFSSNIDYLSGFSLHLKFLEWLSKLNILLQLLSMCKAVTFAWGRDWRQITEIVSWVSNSPYY